MTHAKMLVVLAVAVAFAGTARADLVSYWTFDAADISGSTLTDVVAGVNDGTIYNSPTAVAGKFGEALSFNGSNQYVEIPHSASLDLDGPFAVSAWVNTTSAGGWFRTIVAKYGYTGITESWGLGWTNANTLGFYVRDSGNTRVTPTAATNWGLDGQWYHVLGVQNNGVVRFYADGELAGNEVDTLTASITNTRPVTIARHGTSYVPAKIDDVAIWNDGLSVYKIRQLYSGVAPGDLQDGPSYKAAVLAASPAAYWRLEEVNHTTTPTATDEMGGHNGTYHEGNGREQGAAITESANNAANLDGSNDWVEVATAFANTSGEFASYTVEAWCRPDTIGASRDIVALTNVSGNQHGVLLELQTSGKIRYLHRSPSGSGGGWNVYSDTVLQAGEWYHVAAVKEGTSIKLYVNGELENTDTDGAMNDLDYDFKATIGRLSPTNGIRYFDGLIDEVALYGSALSETTVAEHYAIGTIPEPATLTLLLLGGAGVMARRRRR